MVPTLRRRATDIDNPLNLFRRDVDLLGHDLSRMFWGFVPREFRGDVDTAAYPVDMREENGSIHIDAELPGFTKDQIEISVENGVLRISAERKQEEVKGKKHLHERRYTKIERKLALPCDVNDTKAVAKFDNGVLHLSLPKSGESHGRKIKVG